MILPSYFDSCRKHFWKWDRADEWDIVIMGNSHTIAYKPLISRLVSSFPPNYYPPFEAILMVLLATNKNGLENVNWLKAFFSTPNKFYSYSDDRKDDLIQFLMRLTEIPEVYKTGVKRNQLLTAILDNPFSKISEVPDLEAVGINNYAPFPHPAVFDRGIRTIANLNKRFPTVEQILKHVEKDMEVEAEIELQEVTEALSDADFLVQLAQQEETEFISSLVPHIWSGLHIPSNTLMPNQQPLGGVSDISNKGTFDRLLISEFAHDDVVFLSRLANNEALYIEREVPPSKLDNSQIILIDVSLKNWGTPKKIAYAIQIALTKKEDEQQFKSFAVGESFHEIKTETIEEYVTSLGQVSCTHDARLGLAAFFEEYSDLGETEVIFISTKKVIEQPDFQPVIAKYRDSFKYLITTDLEGQVDLYQFLKHSKRHIQGFKLNLIAVKPRHENPLISDYPILFSHFNNIKYYARTDRLIFILSKNGYAYCKEIGAMKGYRYLPIQSFIDPNLSFAVGAFDKQDYLAVFSSFRKELLLFNLKTLEKEVLTSKEWEAASPEYVYFSEKHFFVEGVGGVWKVNKTISYVESQSQQAFLQKKTLHDSELQQQAEKNSKPTNAYGKLESVFINQAGQLVFNKHVLNINEQAQLKLDQLGVYWRKLSIASVRNGNSFVFKNGFEVQYFLDGMILLRFKNVYRIRVLETNSTFGKVARLIRLKHEIPLNYLKHYLDNKPNLVHLTTSKEEMLELKKEYVNNGLKIATDMQKTLNVFIQARLNTNMAVACEDLFSGQPMYKRDELEGQVYVESSVFYELVIAPFIKAIKDGV